MFIHNPENNAMKKIVWRYSLDSHNMGFTGFYNNSPVMRFRFFASEPELYIIPSFVETVLRRSYIDTELSTNLEIFFSEPYLFVYCFAGGGEECRRRETGFIKVFTDLFA